MTTQSENLGELASALAKAQGQIKSAVKGRENPFYKSSYADLPSVVEACRDALSKNGLSVVQRTDFEGAENWLETILMHSSGQWIKGRYPIRPVKNDPQGLGSAQTYARRYALMAMVGVVADDESDDDGNRASDKGNVNPYSASPKPSAPAADGSLAARKWQKEALDTIGAFTNIDDLRAWESNNDAAMRKLFNTDVTLHRELMGALGDVYERLDRAAAE